MLHVFGCSFSIAHDHKCDIIGEGGMNPTFVPIEHTWTELVSKHLIGTTEHNNTALCGVGNDYIFDTFTNTLAKIQKGDYVIVQPTSFLREWIFEDRPEMANFLSAKYEVGLHINQLESDALESYRNHLYSEHKQKIVYNAFMQAFFSWAIPFGEINVKMLILPGFHTIDGVEGALIDPSRREIGNDKAVQKHMARTGGDNRYNHFSEVNHKVLANKVIDFFDNATQVDLTTDFTANIV